MNNPIFLIQARLGSTRLPQKVLKKIFKDKTLLELVYERVCSSKFANEQNVFVLTSLSKSDDILVDFLKQKKIPYYRGDEQNVFLRFFEFLKQKKDLESYNTMVRVCCDNPFIEPLFIDTLIEKNSSEYDYVSYFDFIKNKPAILTHYGLFTEVINLKTFMNSLDYIDNKKYAEHVTPLFYEKDCFRQKYIKMPNVLYDSNYRFTIDTLRDFENAEKILNQVNSTDFHYKQILDIVNRNITIKKSMEEQIIENSK